MSIILPIVIAHHSIAIILNVDVNRYKFLV